MAKINLLKSDMRVAAISGWGVLISVAVTAIIAGGGIYLWQRPQMQKAQTTLQLQEELQKQILQLRQEIITLTEQKEERGKEQEAPAPQRGPEEQISLDYKFNPAGAGEGQPEASFSPLDKTLTIPLHKKTSAYLQKNAETISSIFCPRDPKDKNLVFISTVRNKTDGKSAANTIYAYNLLNGELKKIYQKTERKIIKTLGLASDAKLVLLAEEKHYQRGNCVSVWAGHEEATYLYLDIAKPANDWQAYAMPSAKIEEGRQEEARCLGAKS